VTIADPLHTPGPPGTRWTTNNFAEAIPGVPTPLSWSIWRHAMTFAAWDNYVRLGVWSRQAAAAEQARGTPVVGIFFGHVAGNLDLMTRSAARIPGYDPAAFERDLFGIDSAETPFRSTRERWAAVAARAPVTLAGHGRRLEQLREDTEDWWRNATAATYDAPWSVTLLADARDRFARVLSAHTIQSQLGQALFDRLGKVAAAAGVPGLERELVTGAGDLEEVVLARDLWALARKELDRDAFLSRHGFHGPAEGELSSRTWREDPSALDALVVAYANESDERSPVAMTARQTATRRHAEVRLLAATAPARRPAARALVRLARRHVARREIGKTAFLMAVDVARHAARGLGRYLPLDHPDDVFYLTYDEVMAGHTADIAARKATRQRYQQLELPAVWTGDPAPRDAEAIRHGNRALLPRQVVTGVAVSPGVVEGTARVVVDPAACDGPVGPDEVLVARTTDPSWVSLFLTAGALVIDIGGPMSHGAIVARELGVPCVIGTGDGTRRISTGDRVRVDGHAGTVEVLRISGTAS
jgi:pyruvate,water dikinase